MKTYGIGGSSPEDELAVIQPKVHLVDSIQKSEFQSRIQKAAHLLRENKVPAMYLHAGTNLYYFTGTRWNNSERMVGALLFEDGSLEYIAPYFEIGTVLDFMLVEGPVHGWEEHESPYTLFSKILEAHGIEGGKIYMDETTPFFVTNGILKVNHTLNLLDAKPITAGCRMVKSEAELAIMQLAMDITLEVQQAAARIMYPGITSDTVTQFIHEAHKRYGASAGSYFCIVLFGVDSSFPHGVKNPKALKENEVVLVDTGCQIHDYISDITRTYVYGKANKLQKRIWNIEKEAQQVAFQAATLGTECGTIDIAVRKYLESQGLGPDYKLPGLPHRTGHGIGLDIHEWPYLVKSDNTKLEPGMCVSNEPMICVADEFGIRLEDHIYMTNKGPKWFTKPAYSIEDPFGESLK